MAPGVCEEAGDTLYLQSPWETLGLSSLLFIQSGSPADTMVRPTFGVDLSFSVKYLWKQSHQHSQRRVFMVILQPATKGERAHL